MLTQSTSPRRINRIAALGFGVLLVLAAALAAMPANAAPPTPQVIDGSVDWHEPPQIISNGERIAYPYVAIDSNNVTNVVYVTLGGDILFTSNAGGAFNTAGKRLDSAGTPGVAPPVALAVGPGNVLGVVYAAIGSSNQVYYRESTDGGKNWTPRQQISSGDKSTAPHLAFDAAGNAHIVWIDDRCGASLYNVYYRVRFANGSLSGTSKPRDACGTYQNRPQITIANGKPQVVFQNGSSSGAEIYYRRLEGDQWVGQSVSASNGIGSQNATIASDGGNNLFVAWDENVGGHDILFRVSFDGGANWSNSINMSADGELSTSPNLTWSPQAKRAYLVWEDAHDSDDGKPEIWSREFDPISKDTTFADRISHFGGRSRWPTVGAGTSRADIVWMDETRDFFQAYDLGGTVKGSVTACDGSLVLDAGADKTKSTTLTGAITPANSCVPDQMQVSLDTPLTDATPKKQYSASFTIPNVSGSACDHTVFVRLFKSSVGGNSFSDSIKVDSQVDADVSATNPHLNHLPPTSGAPGASDGDPSYTRDLSFFLGINDTGDCTGLLNFNVPGSTPSSGPIPAGGYANTLPLPVSTTPPTMTINVIVSDQLVNQRSYQSTLIFDSTPPVLDTTKSPAVTSLISATYIIVPLSFSKIDVSDNLYGTPSSGKQFWGVWVANSRTNAEPAINSGKWFPVQVTNPGATFTIDWSLFAGLGSTEQTEGNYYVFVKFLDGAGNATDQTIKTKKIILAPNFTKPTQHLPAIFR